MAASYCPACSCSFASTSRAALFSPVLTPSSPTPPGRNPACPARSLLRENVRLQIEEYASFGLRASCASIVASSIEEIVRLSRRQPERQH